MVLSVPDRRATSGSTRSSSTPSYFSVQQRIAALDATTGKELWSHPVEVGAPGNRGINYWESRDRSDRRLLFGAAGTLRAIDARTGAPIKTFGKDGHVDMREGALRPLGGPSGTPGRVFENLFISRIESGEGYGSTPGDIRAFDVVTGRLVWTFHTIPHHGRIRLRHVARRRVQVGRRRQCLGRALGR